MKLTDLEIININMSVNELNSAIYETKKPYIAFCDNENSDEGQFASFVSACNTLPDYSRYVCKLCSSIEDHTRLKAYIPMGKKAGVINTNDNILALPLFLQGSIFKTSSITDAGLKFNSAFEYLKNELFCMEYTMHYPRFYYLPDVSFTSSFPFDETSKATPQSYELGWYQESTIPLYNTLTEQNETLPASVQHALLYIIAQRFWSNNGSNVKHVFDDIEASETYLAEVKDVMQHIDKEVILKSGDELVVNKRTKFYIAGLDSIDAVGDSTVRIESLNVIHVDGKKYLDIFASVSGTSSESSYRLFAVLTQQGKSQRIQLELTPIVAEIYTFFNREGFSFHAFHGKILMDQVVSAEIHFEIQDMMEQSLKCNLNFHAKKWQSRLVSHKHYIYWYSDGLIFSNSKNKIKVIRSSIFARIKAEAMLLSYILLKKDVPKGVLRLRVKYWLTLSKYNSKRIWVYYDKIFKSGDNGEYAWKYALTQDDGIKKIFIQDPNTTDGHRLISEGYHITPPGGDEAILSTLSADVVYLTHIPPLSQIGLESKYLPYVKGLLHSKFIRLYHGFPTAKNSIYSRIAWNAIGNVVPTYYENEFYMLPENGYTEDQEITCGNPRYDGLIDAGEKRILFAPTWRPALVDNFEGSSYHRIYDSILKNKKLQDTALENGYKIMLFLHPMFAQYTDLFESNSVIETVNSLSDKGYVEVMCRSSLMVTDYSSVQYDFAYMRKPVVYFHDPVLPMWRIPEFDYEKLGLGEICSSSESLIDTLCEYMKNDCKLKSEYSSRIENFFIHNDRNSSKRLYEAVRDIVG